MGVPACLRIKLKSHLLLSRPFARRHMHCFFHLTFLPFYLTFVFAVVMRDPFNERAIFYSSKKFVWKIDHYVMAIFILSSTAGLKFTLCDINIDTSIFFGLVVA